MFDWSDKTIRWAPLYFASVSIFFLSLLARAFDPLLSSLLLLFLFGFLSRVPCMVSDFTKDMEFVDFLTVMTAVSLGGVWGGLFGASILLFSRLFNSGSDGGYSEHPGYTVMEAFDFLLIGSVSGLLYSVFNGSLLYTMYAFTALRYGLTVLFTLLFAPSYLFYCLQLLAVGAVVAYTTNTVSVLLFGDYLVSILRAGPSLSPWAYGFMFALLALWSVLRLSLGPEKAEADVQVA